jgi:DNA primase
MWIDYRALRNQIPMEYVLALIGYHASSRRGQQLRGPCPFHAPERSHARHFSIDLHKGRFHCFRCGAQGNQLDLWAQYRQLPLYSAAVDLCHHAGVVIPLIGSRSETR